MSFWSNIGRAANLFSEGMVTNAEMMLKASRDPGVKADGPIEDPEALVWDPFSIIEQLGYKDRPSAITYGTLKTMTWRTPVVQNIILTRLNQLAQFANRQQDKFETGYRVRLEDKSVRMTAADQKRASELEKLLQNCGIIQDNVLERCSLETFLRAAGRDSLTFDQMCFEVCRSRKGTPAAFYAVDASTIRLADTATTTHEYDPDKTHTVQIYDNMVINQWTRERMAFCIRNPHTDIRLYGYGVSELEMLINVVTAILWAFEYNQRFFSQGSVAKGLLHIKGTMNQSQLRAFRRHWYQMISGIENAWRSPVLNSEGDVQWIDMHPSNRDMEFSAWMDFLIKNISSCFQMDSMEIGFKYGDSGSQKAMFESGNKEKLTASKDKGLKPFVSFIFRELSRYIIQQAEPGFIVEPVGLERETKKELAELNSIRVKSTHTLNELRAEQDLEPVEEGDIVLDPTYVQHLDNLAQQKAQKEQMGMQQDQMLMDAMSGGGKGEDQQKDDDEQDDDSFSENDFNQLQDHSSGSAGPAGKPTFKSFRRAPVRVIEVEV